MTRAIERDLTTGLFLLRAVQLGLSIADLELLDIGTVYDMIIERANDDFEYTIKGTAEDFKRLF